MSDDLEDFDFDFFAEPSSNFVNQRRTVRYVRKDISATILIKPRWFQKFFRFAQPPKEIPVELHDISNRGCLLACPMKLAAKAKVVIVLQFEAGKRFEIDAVVARVSELDDEYGIKFSAYQNELGEYMFSTQSELIFK